MCGRSKGQTQSQQTTTTQATPEAMAAYQDVLERAQQVAATPYQAYTGDRVAGFTPFQEQAFGQIAGLQGAGMGTLGEAGDLARQGAQAISGEDIQRAMDPYQQQVIQTTMDEMARQNAIEQSRLQGQAISAGAYGGDRAGIAASELAKRQGDVRAATMASLLSQGYGRAVAQAQADRQAAQAGAGQLSALAQQEYALPMAQTQALGQAGTAQQQLAQMQLNVPYQQYLEERAYPFQTAQWLAGLTTGVGGAMGGTSSAQGTMTPAQPNPLNTILGLGLGIGGLGVSGGGTLLGNFLNRAEGGRVDDKAMDAPVQLPGLSAALPYSKGFVPTAMQYRPLPIPATSAPPVPQAPPSEAQKFLGQAMDLAKSIRDARKTEMPSAQSWASGTTITPETEATPTPEWGYMAHGGRVPMADGGVPVENIPVTKTSPVLVPNMMLEEMPSDLTAPRRPNLSEVEAMSLPAPTERFSGPAVQPLDMEIPKFRGAAAYQPPSPPMAQPRAKDVTPPAETKSGFGLSPEAGQALMQAGFALMASRSPWLGQAVGEAGLVGTQAYTEAQKVAELRRKQTEAEKIQRERMEKDYIKTDMVTEDNVRVYMNPHTRELVDARFQPVSPDAKLRSLDVEKVELDRMKAEAARSAAESKTGNTKPLLKFVTKEGKNVQVDSQGNLFGPNRVPITEADIISIKEWEMKQKEAEKKPEDFKRAANHYRDVQVQQFGIKADLASLVPEINNFTVGLSANTPLAKISGTQAGDIREKLDQIKSQLQLGALKELKEASKTGASGLGATTHKEIDMLGDQIARLSPTQSPQQLLAEIGNLTRRFDFLKNAMRSDLEENYSSLTDYETMLKRRDEQIQSFVRDEQKAGRGAISIPLLKDGKTPDADKMIPGQLYKYKGRYGLWDGSQILPIQ